MMLMTSHVKQYQKVLAKRHPMYNATRGDVAKRMEIARTLGMEGFTFKARCLECERMGLRKMGERIELTENDLLLHLERHEAMFRRSRKLQQAKR